VTAPFHLAACWPPEAHRISAGDTVRLAVLAGPGDGIDHSVVFEVWEPGGAQPINSHPASTETFLFLRGCGEAESDGQRAAVRAGQLLVLPAGTRHRIRNTGTGRLYAVTTMLPDAGFADLIRRGPAAPLDEGDLAVLAGTGSGGEL
jgi:mannose-6-phosphate isomerase-like protein (cupin superfamily)